MKICCFVLAVLMTYCLLPAAAQEQDDRLEPVGIAEAVALITDMTSAADPARWAQANKARFTPELAVAVDQVTSDAVDANRVELAVAAATLGALAHGYLGDQDRALSSTLTRLELLFQQADRAQEYADVRASALRALDQAEQFGLMDLAFRCAVVAADASYFRSLAGDVAQNERDDPLPTLEDLLVAYPLLRYTAEPAWVERLASLTAATVRTAIGRYFLSYEKIKAALTQLTPLVELTIPVAFSYGNPTISNIRKSIDTASVMARLSYRYGNPVVASSRLVIAERRAIELRDTDLVIDLISQRYAGHRQAGSSPAQLRQLRNEAWERLQDLRNGYRSSSGRIWAAYHSDEFFGDMLKDELDDGVALPDEVFARVESLKARTLLDRLTMPGTAELRTAQALALENKGLGFKKSRLVDADLTLAEMRLVSQLSGFDFHGGGESGRVEALSTLEDLYRGAGIGFEAAANTTPLTTLQQALELDEALLEYVIPPDALHPAPDMWILLITRNAVRSAHVALDEVLGIELTTRMSVGGEAPLDASALGTLVISTRIDIRSSNDTAARRQLADLYELLIQPLAAQGFRPEAFKRLVIVPHGPLHYVPFAALLDAKGKFLISKTEIVVAPSASVWRLLGQRKREDGSLVVFANPDLGSRGVVDLPFSDQEGVAIVESMPAGSSRPPFRRREATRARLIAEAPGAGILHLATHGEFPDESAANAHALWLADEGGHSVALPAARLVVLSICNGGLYRIGPSDEPYGLMPAFLEAGASNVLGTLWPLDDQFGRDFMIEFYNQLQVHGVAGALRQASIRFINEDEYLRNWSAFVLVGSGRLD
jgi:CHAT domain